MEEHFRCQETFIANVDTDHFVAQCFMHKAFEFGGLDKLALVKLLLVELLVLF